MVEHWHLHISWPIKTYLNTAIIKFTFSNPFKILSDQYENTVIVLFIENFELVTNIYIITNTTIHAIFPLFIFDYLQLKLHSIKCILANNLLKTISHSGRFLSEKKILLLVLYGVIVVNFFRHTRSSSMKFIILDLHSLVIALLVRWFLCKQR